MQIRQSDLKSWQRCPLAWRYRHIDGLPDSQGAAAVYGTVIHACVEYMEANADYDGALRLFEAMWSDPQAHLGEKGRIDHWEYGRTRAKGFKEGPKALHDWWSLHQWDTDIVLGREFTFNVPIGDGHILHGTVDKLVERQTSIGPVLTTVDFKTGKKPTYGYLADDLQFTAYSYATTRPEFWATMPNGGELYERYRDYPRRGEWIQMRGGVERMDAGPRDETHYRRLIYACNAFAESVALRIFVPQISGETCRFCSYRDHCGLRPVLAETPKY